MSLDKMIRDLVAKEVATQLAQAQGHRSDRSLTPHELAARWGCSISKVYAIARTGGLPALRVGRLVRFRLVDVEGYEATK